MKRILLTSAAVLLGYWIVFQWEQGPEEEDSLVMVEDLAPREAALSLPIPRTPPERRPTEAWVGATAEETAHRYVEAQRENWGIQPFHELRAEVNENPLGTTVRYQVYQGEYRIIGMDIQLRVTPNHEVKDINLQYRPVAEADMNGPMLEPEEMEATVAEQYETVPDTMTTVLFLDTEASAPVPAVAMTVRDKADSTQVKQAVFRASDGQVLATTKARAEFR